MICLHTAINLLYVRHINYLAVFKLKRPCCLFESTSALEDFSFLEDIKLLSLSNSWYDWLRAHHSVITDSLPRVWKQQAVGGRPPQYAPVPCDLDLWPSDLESGVWVMCDVGYLCANFSLPRPLCSRLRPDVRDRYQTDRRQTASSLNAPAYGAGA